MRGRNLAPPGPELPGAFWRVAVRSGAVVQRALPVDRCRAGCGGPAYVQPVPERGLFPAGSPVAGEERGTRWSAETLVARNFHRNRAAQAFYPAALAMLSRLRPGLSPD